MSQTQPAAESAINAVLKVGPPTVGTAAVWGMSLNEIAQFVLTVITLVWWLWLLGEKIQLKMARRRALRLRRERRRRRNGI